MKTTSEEMLQRDMYSFDISQLGFVLTEPLMDLPEYYQIWMEIAHNICHLINTHQLRSVVQKMPMLSINLLSSYRELRLAHLALGFITMGYVWQEEKNPAQRLPKALAVPFTLVSRKLDLPAILTYSDCVLANWKLKDPAGDLELKNMDLILNFPGNESCRGFLLVSWIVEKAAVCGLKGILAVRMAMEEHDETGLLKGLNEIAASLKQMKKELNLMHEHVNQTEFFGTLRIFFSGWKDNPQLPNGLVYEGVNDEPVYLSGCSAAQSSAVQSFDAILGVQHEEKSVAFLRRMRLYMPPGHKKLIETLCKPPWLRDLVVPSPPLHQAYNACVSALEDLRTFHLCVVAKFIIIPGGQARATAGRCPLSGGGSGLGLGSTGTGGSNPMLFLKSVRDATHNALIPCPSLGERILPLSMCDRN
ncbi:indoleamine 2,3-dioxygenase 2-like isoform X1 [Gadus chalcogrammus]|uniref:indoleamine 2,3-dioxygenase 2-like isoform X1 n=1 Tax=Gadus chalcogrammus TaxID=1042646 RepID=UPI0024C49DCA|nr:indoleamine 2,3-dioxygenase 2-like isoform X1 [Gadus chalcogrammus]